MPARGKSKDLCEIVRITNEEEWKTAPDLNKIRKYINEDMTIRIIGPGGKICCQDTVGKCVYYVVSGRYFHYRDSKEGKRNLITLNRGPEWIGIDRALDMENANITEDLVMEECIVIDINVEYFIKCIREGGELALYIIKNLLGKMSSASRRGDYMLFNDARTQTLFWLNEYWNTNHDKEGCVVRIKNEYIADAIGISARTLYRVINKLKSEGMISTRKGNIVIDNSQIQKIADSLIKGSGLKEKENG